MMTDDEIMQLTPGQLESFNRARFSADSEAERQDAGQIHRRHNDLVKLAATAAKPKAPSRICRDCGEPLAICDCTD